MFPALVFAPLERRIRGHMKNASLASAALLSAAALGVGLIAPACGTSGSGATTSVGTDQGDASTMQQGGDSGSTVILPSSGRDGGSGGDDASATGCTNLQCQIHTCPGGGSTTITGAVYDPAGNNPLYNVVVYVPNSTPSPLTTGASCDSCGSLYTGEPVAAAVTDATGKFTIKNAPDGASIPLVIQIGKWRKQTSIPSVAACTNNAVSTKLTLPANQSEGDIPSIAISTGGADSLECLLRRIGIDATEYGPGASGSGRIHIFQGSADPGDYAATTSPTPAPLSSQALWSSLANLMPYDITILSCEGEETQDQPTGDAGPSTGLTTSDQDNLFQYTSAGGRVFASHYHYAWLNTGPFGAENIATWTTGANTINDSSNNPITNPFNQGPYINANIVTTLVDGGVFAKGAALDTWLSNVSALNPSSSDAPGELVITEPKHNADLAGVMNTPSQPWITADSHAQTEVVDYPVGADGGIAVSVAGATQYLSFNTPVDAGLDDAGEPAYCGRVVYSDLHVGAASGDYASSPTSPVVPAGCANNPLSPQEKALEFMLFDLSSCVTPDTGSGQQAPPTIIK
jgi:hypothetical protein